EPLLRTGDTEGCVVADRDIKDARELEAVAGADLAGHFAAEAVELRTCAMERDSADAGVPAKQSALRTAQHFDTFHVEQRADDGAGARDVGIVEEDGDARLGRRVAGSAHGAAAHAGVRG